MALKVNFTGKASLSTETLPTGYTTDVGNGIGMLDGRLGLLKGRVDAALTGGTNTSTDTYEVIHVPAGFYIMNVWAYVVEAEATNTTATIEVGIGNDPDEFIKATSPDTTGEIFGMTGDALAINGTVLTAADTIDITVATAALTNAVIDVYALVVDMRETRT